MIGFLHNPLPLGVYTKLDEEWEWKGFVALIGILNNSKGIGFGIMGRYEGTENI